MKKIFVLTILIYGRIFAASLQSELICSVFTPNSILLEKEKYRPLFIGGRSRYATCTGVAWFHGNYVASLNLYGEKIIIYRFDEESMQFTMQQEIRNADGAQLSYPENLVASSDGLWLAVCNGHGSAVNFYAIDPQSHLIAHAPSVSLQPQGLTHNVRFTADSTYMATAGFDNKASICIYRILNRQGIIDPQLVYKKEDNLPYKAKALHFTKDKRYMVIGYASTASSHVSGSPSGVLSVYSFNSDHGCLQELITTVPVDYGMEDIAFTSDEKFFIVTSQSQDRLIVYPFDVVTGQIGSNCSVLQNPEVQLSFPHGLSLSHDGKYLVVANYGDDKFNLYRMHY